MGQLETVWSRDAVRAVALALATWATFAASLQGGFLNYDDPWLIEHNPVLDAPATSALPTIFADFSREARLALGAEYLPVRDLSVWLDVQLFGRNPQALRAIQLLLYVAAVLAFRSGFVRLFGAGRGELIAWLFALHPVHLESVAWLAGRKDVLALLCLGFAFARHARGGRDARFSVPLLWTTACLSKSMSVGFIGPLLATDWWLSRRPDAKLYGSSALAVACVMWVHIQVGHSVGMVGGPLSDPWQAWVSMGPVWLAYLRLVVDPAAVSVRHDVAVLSHWTPLAVLGWMLMLAAAGWAARTAWRGQRLPATALLWFAVPLGPVSQVLVPLQNVLADRYLWLSVAGPLMCVAHLDSLVPRRSARLVAYLWLGVLASSTALRAPTFTSSVRLFVEATQKTQTDPVAPYQLGKALQKQKRLDEAAGAFGLALQRCGPLDPTLPSAANNLAKILASQGHLADARGVLRTALRTFPENHKLQSNLRKVEEALHGSTGEGPPLQP